ncbi:thioredoxin domain-containing protein [Candidatus Gottesmanbacteria bacterium]|nr:thioredoxin domain-containing protein [Candidatus Gottesmanbacteria bacterium]
MTNDVKVIIGVILATGMILLAAIFFFSSSSTPTQPQKADSSLLVRADSQKVSSPSATVTLVEFADFQCPACGAYYPILTRLKNEFATDLTFVFRNFPLQQHKNASLAASAAEAAGLQGKFWEMHDILFEKQNEWSESNSAQDLALQYAQSLGLNSDMFKKDIESVPVKEKIDQDVKDGFALGVNSTPTFYINGEEIENPRSYEDFQTLIKAAIIKSPITVSPTEKYHAHVAFKVYILGKTVDFSQDKYQSKEGNELNENIHLHDGNGEIIHLHKEEMTIGDFFSSLGIGFTPTCFTLSENEKYCSSEKNTLQFLINGKPSPEFGAYKPVDLDRILISFGDTSGTALAKQIDSISDTACIYSEKCPERGKPPTEHCVGGLGSDCEEE